MSPEKRLNRIASSLISELMVEINRSDLGLRDPVIIALLKDLFALSQEHKTVVLG